MPDYECQMTRQTLDSTYLQWIFFFLFPNIVLWSPVDELFYVLNRYDFFNKLIVTTQFVLFIFF